MNVASITLIGLWGGGEGVGEFHCPTNHTHPLFLGTAGVRQMRHKLIKPGLGLISSGLSMWMTRTAEPLDRSVTTPCIS